jgi:large subunit ribosomal protein L15
MIRLGELKGNKGSTHRVKRLGRGPGSKRGGTSTKGHKGLLARKGGGRRPGYEGGQTPLHRRIPKRGFHNFTREEYAIVNLDQIETSGLAEISMESLRKARILRGNERLLKVLGNGDLKRAVSVKADKFSATAKAKIEKAGGKLEVVNVRG